MILTDAGPLVALIDADESDHQICVLSLQTLTLPLLTTCLRSPKPCTCWAEQVAR